MINQVMLVGRIANDINEKDDNITVAVTRSFKNDNGEYETDFIDVTIRGTIAKTTTEYCKKGDIIGVKGSIRSEIIDNEKKMILVAERITFLSSKKEDFE